jgi:hypothetical protein
LPITPLAGPKMIIELTASQMMIANLVASMRQVQNIKEGRRDRYTSATGGRVTDTWQKNAESCMAEMAVARHLCIYWDGNIGNRAAADVGPYQVRHTDRANGCLLLHPPDKDGDIFILVTGENGTYNLSGWIYARDGKTLEYWKDPVGGRPAFFVPQKALNPLNIIPKL